METSAKFCANAEKQKQQPKKCVESQHMLIF